MDVVGIDRIPKGLVVCFKGDGRIIEIIAHVRILLCCVGRSCRDLQGVQALHHFGLDGLLGLCIDRCIGVEVLVLKRLIQVLYKVRVLKPCNGSLLGGLIAGGSGRALVSGKGWLGAVLCRDALQDLVCFDLSRTERIPLGGLKIIQVIAVCGLAGEVLAPEGKAVSLLDDTRSEAVGLILGRQPGICSDGAVDDLILKAVDIFVEHRVQRLDVVVIDRMPERLAVVRQRLDAVHGKVAVDGDDAVSRLPAHVVRQVGKLHPRTAQLTALCSIPVHGLLQQVELFGFGQAAVHALTVHGIQAVVAQVPIPGRMCAVIPHAAYLRICQMRRSAASRSPVRYSVRTSSAPEKSG